MFGGRRFGSRFRSRLWKTSVEEEVEAELAFHLEMRVRDYEARGLSPAAAREEAERRLGDRQAVAAACRTLGRSRDRGWRRAEWLAELRQDLRFALRQLRATPAFAVAAVVALALGLGAAAAVWSVVEAVVWRPPPFAGADQLVRVWQTNPQAIDFTVSQPDFLDWRGRATSFERLAAFEQVVRNVIGPAGPQRVAGVQASAGLLPLLGRRPLLGRVFSEAEDAIGGDHRVAVLGYELWRRQCAGADVLSGCTLLLDGEPVRAVGVMPAGFDFPERAGIWTPLVANRQPARGAIRTHHHLEVVGRLRRGSTLGQARAELAAIAGILALRYPESNRGWGVRLASFAEWRTGARWRRRTLAALGAAALLWLLASTNVANLLAVRATARQREIDLRAALGAGRGRIVRQLLAEGLLLALLGAAVGLLLAAGGAAALSHLDLGRLPRLAEVRLGPGTAGFTLLAALAAALVLAGAPALQLLRGAPHETLRFGARLSPPRERRLRDLLVVAEMALAMTLLVAAGLTVRSLLRLQGDDPGYDPDQVVALSLNLAGKSYPPPRMREFMSQLEQRVARLPGVLAVGAANLAPLAPAGGAPPNTPFTLAREGTGAAGPPAASGGGSDFLFAHWRVVTPGYFQVLGMKRVAGRLLAASDTDGAHPVVVIDETLARRWWPGEDPLGKRIRWGWTAGAPLSVVGVVGGVRDLELDAEPRPVLFFPYAERVWRAMMLLVKVSGDPRPVAAAVRRQIRELDRLLPVPEASVLRAGWRAAVAPSRFSTLLLGLFAILALALAATGVYGATAYAVGERRAEIAVRQALGATPRALLWLFAARGALLGLAGVALGWVAALAFARQLGSLLYGTGPAELAAYAFGGLLLAGIAAGAGAAAARRATRVPAVLALRGGL
ncbi:MAG TPA: ADOP family duplicated permease [Thermoanaerobaculia bacterium]|nr:ADOP family duplicated permease [Thermoanaerobaculia bacterium]